MNDSSHLAGAVAEKSKHASDSRMKADPLVFIVRTGGISIRSRLALRDAGVIVAEVSEPSECQFVRGREPINTNDLAAAAVAALAVGPWKTSGGSLNTLGEANQVFMNALAEMLKAKKK